MEPISEVASTTSRLNEQQANHNSTIAAQAQVVDEDAKAREVRSTEGAGDSANAGPKTQYEGTTTETTIENKNDIVFVRYDAEGSVVNRVPPEYTAEG